MDENQKLLSEFAEIFIKDVRDRTIQEAMKVISGKIKSKIGISIYQKLEEISLEYFDGLEDLIVDCVDSSLNNFFWMIEQSDKIKLIIEDENKIYDIEQMSGDLCIDYWNFVDDFSRCKRLL